MPSPLAIVGAGGALLRPLARLDGKGRVVDANRKRPLYVRRRVINASELIDWAKSQGFATTLPAEDMHVTCCFSKTPVDWDVMGAASSQLVSMGGKRSVEPLGDEGAIVLKFEDTNLHRRWSEMRDAGASWDYASYKPHVTISYNPPWSLAYVTPYHGAIVLGPEIFEEIVESWKDRIAENAQRDYVQIKRRLDALESRARDGLRDALEECRDALLARVRRASDLTSLVNSLTRLPRFGAVRSEVRAMLERAREAGRRDARREVREARREAAFAGTESSFAPRAATRWLRSHAFWVSGILGERVLNEAKGVILNGLKTGKATEAIAELLFAAFVPYLGDADVIADDEQLAPYRLETIVRTNNTTAYNHGRLTEFLDPEIYRFMKGVRYSAVLDSRTTPVCLFLDGKVFKPSSPDLEALLPPNHFNALAAGTLIRTAKGDIPIEHVDVGDFVLTHRGRLRRVYAVMSKCAASINELRLSTGRVLCATDEHPILTTTGWLRCDNLQIGDVLFQHGEQVPGAVGVGVRRPNDYPSMFDEPAIAYERYRFAPRSSLTAVDFKTNVKCGPGEIQDEVPYLVLKRERISCGRQARSESRFGFRWCRAPRVCFPASHLLAAAMRRILVALHALARLLGQMIVFLAPAPRPMLFTAALGYGFRHTIADRDLLGFAANLDTQTAADSIQGAFPETEAAIDVADGFPLVPMPLLDKCRNLIGGHASASWCGTAIITAVKVHQEQDVWNLAVEEDETYHAEGIVVHNCRSIVVPIVAGEQVDEKEFITPAEIGRARALADTKFLSQVGDAWTAYREAD